jgi:hypothetical protein
MLIPSLKAKFKRSGPFKRYFKKRKNKNYSLFFVSGLCTIKELEESR